MKNKITDPDVLDKFNQRLKIKIDNVNERYHEMMQNFYNQIKNLKYGPHSRGLFFSYVYVIHIIFDSKWLAFFSCPIVLLSFRGALLYHSSSRLGLYTVIAGTPL